MRTEMRDVFIVVVFSRLSKGPVEKRNGTSPPYILCYLSLAEWIPKDSFPVA